jgi:hypothetical protein
LTQTATDNKQPKAAIPSSKQIIAALLVSDSENDEDSKPIKRSCQNRLKIKKSKYSHKQIWIASEITMCRSKPTSSSKSNMTIGKTVVKAPTKRGGIRSSWHEESKPKSTAGSHRTSSSLSRSQNKAKKEPVSSEPFTVRQGISIGDESSEMEGDEINLMESKVSAGRTTKVFLRLT